MTETDIGTSYELAGLVEGDMNSGSVRTCEMSGSEQDDVQQQARCHTKVI